MAFLEDLDPRPLALDVGDGGEPRGLYVGGGGAWPLEVAHLAVGGRPAAAWLREAWRRRAGGRPSPILVVATHAKVAHLAGPSGPDPAIHLDLPLETAERLCRVALTEPDSNAALRFLRHAMPEAEGRVPGLRNEGLLATHELAHGAPRRADWAAACQQAGKIRDKRGADLIRALGFSVRPMSGSVSMLLTGDRKTAIAVFLDRTEAPEAALKRFGGASPVSYALAKADQEGLHYVIVTTGGAIRLYPVDPATGVGGRGRPETFVEIHLDLLADEHAGYLWLLFAAGALDRGGTLAELLETSGRFATELGRRLRERIYEGVITPLAAAIAAARRLDRPTAVDLEVTYRATLTLLFRLLFVAYAEDKDLLPYRTNERYRKRSLKQIALELRDIVAEGRPFDTGAHYYKQVQGLFSAVDQGHTEWGVPAYDGGLFSVDPQVSEIGPILAAIELGNDRFAPALAALLLDQTTDDGSLGPVDFRSLGVREFGTIYEGLLECELSVAEEDLTLDRTASYRPVRTERDRVVVPQGAVYLHNRSGGRKATGSYYTKDFAVEHLLDHALEPALRAHLSRVDATLDPAQAARAFFEFRVGDIAMGSGHFLIAAVDRIERRFSSFLANKRLPGVLDELQRLRAAAEQALGDAALGVEIEDTQLLRRQIARRCIFGVDLNAMAVDLARLSVWVHTFVPGLPLSFLDHNLTCGNSLVGIATFEEARRFQFEAESRTKQWMLFSSGYLEDLLARGRADVRALAALADETPREVALAREADRRAHARLEPLRALFTILTASRIDPEIRQDVERGNLREILDAPDTLTRWVLHERALKRLSGTRAFHFPAAFPEVFEGEQPGFDVVVGNPPWEEASIEEDDFWTRFVPGYQGYRQTEREQIRRRWRKERPDLVERLEAEQAQAAALRDLLLSGDYPGMGRGDPDLYKAFCWRFVSIVKPGGGRVGVVLPRSAFSAKGSTEFRKTVLSTCTFHDLTFLLNNQQWIFDEVHPQYTIALAAWERQPPPKDASLPTRGPYRSRREFDEGVRKAPVPFPVAGVLTWTDTASLPLLPSAGSAAVFLQLRQAPRLDHDDGKTWLFRPYAELHATNDKPHMLLTEKPPKGSVPVFKGESFDLWQPDTGSYYAYADRRHIVSVLNEKRRNSARRAASPFAHVPEADLVREETLPFFAPRIAFRDVTRSTDSRTVRAALLPAEVAITNKGPFLIRIRGNQKDEAYLLGVMCSIPFDWYARRFVEVNLNFFILNALPVPRPPRTDARWKRIVKLAGRLAAPDERFAAWARLVGVGHGEVPESERDDMVAELDALVARLYGLAEPEVVHVFETFHEGWDHEARLARVLRHFRAGALA